MNVGYEEQVAAVIRRWGLNMSEPMKRLLIEDVMQLMLEEYERGKKEAGQHVETP